MNTTNHATVERFESVDIDVSWLVVSSKVRAACEANQCGHYDQCYQCPPRVGTLELWADRLRTFEHARLVILTLSCAKAATQSEILETRRPLNDVVLDLERRLRAEGSSSALALVAGHCALCTECSVVRGASCVYPSLARPSLEAIGVDVGDVFGKLGRKLAFEPGQVTWVGAVLW
jgi:predicted metal-binding protein